MFILLIDQNVGSLWIPATESSRPQIFIDQNDRSLCTKVHIVHSHDRISLIVIYSTDETIRRPLSSSAVDSQVPPSLQFYIADCMFEWGRGGGGAVPEMGNI